MNKSAYYNYVKGKIYLNDCFNELTKIKSESIDFILTDPPYFIDGMGNDWDSDKLNEKRKKAGIISGRPIGMKYDKNQSYDFQKFLTPFFEECFRVLKPGAFIVSFSQARLYHRMAVAAEDQGFEIRDMLVWNHVGQAKAFSQTHFVNKSKKLTKDEKIKILDNLKNRKTPQLKPEIEPMILGQKPKKGTFVDNWIEYQVGLIDSSQSIDGTFPGNLMKVAKPRKDEKGEGNHHLTVKPVLLLSHLIKLLTIENQIILDPFLGSGSTAIAALITGRKFIGIEREPKYFDISVKRIKDELVKPKQSHIF